MPACSKLSPPGIWNFLNGYSISLRRSWTALPPEPCVKVLDCEAGAATCLTSSRSTGLPSRPFPRLAAKHGRPGMSVRVADLLRTRCIWQSCSSLLPKLHLGASLECLPHLARLRFSHPCFCCAAVCCVDGQICRSDGCAVCCLLQNSILHVGRGPQAAQRCWWVHFGCSWCVNDSYDSYE